MTDIAEPARLTRPTPAPVSAGHWFESDPLWFKKA
ncbi:MAG: hypothetical protein QOI80_1769, partial [Solirubrobacteraceae bacterium]|nr:hypothetical protein [Solirubrobacteraceae bacterium]